MPPRIERPVLAVDVVLLHADGPRLLVLLQRRPTAPFAGALALPGVAVRADETLETAARRALSSRIELAEQDVAGLPLEQVATFDALYRDPRGRTVSVAYMALSRSRLEVGKSSGEWALTSSLQPGSLPFDHGEIVEATVARLRGKLRYTNIASRLLGEMFRIDELREVYEAILGRPINRSNFRTRLLRLGMIEQMGALPGSLGSQGGRPPHLFRFKRQELSAEDREFV